ncbi:MAG: ATP-binding cassette domain-containing protein [Anaerobutyricum hallii]
MGDQKILNNVDMECPCKSITGIIGRNGSGKTVLLKRHYEQGT